jgi:SARP family transcriptional regulator, regulator of embCAB operon
VTGPGQSFATTMGNTGRGFGVLGPLQLSAGGSLVPLGAPKQRAVLAMLVINRNRPVSVEALINAVWEAPPSPVVTISASVVTSSPSKSTRAEPRTYRRRALV